MSWDALSWAAKQKVGRAADKLILLGLAERHNPESGVAYPSVAWLTEFSSLDRKTVMASIDRLEAAGLISDSGQRSGRTLQVKAYRLHLGGSCAFDDEIHYIYRLTDTVTGEFYIGVRSCVGDPLKDRYKGSGRWPTGACLRGNEISKKIVSTFATRREAEIEEARLIKDAMEHPLCKNIAKEYQKRERSKTIPKTAQLNSTIFSGKQSQKRDTEPVREPVSSEAKASSPRPREKFPAPPGVPDEAWHDFLASPKRRKAGMSVTAYSGILNNLRALAEHGYPPGKMIALAVERGWATVKLEWVQNDERGQTNRGSAGRMGGHQPGDGLSPTARAAIAVFGAPSASH